MTRLAVLFSYGIILTAAPNFFSLAGPACSKKNWKQESCVQRCKGKWGYPGLMMGSSSWGSVIQKTPEEDWNSVIAVACGTPVSSASSSSATAAGALGNSTSSNSTSSVAVSATQVVSSSLSSSSSASTSSTAAFIATSSSSAALSTSTTPAPTTSSSTEEQPSSTSTSTTSVFTPATTSESTPAVTSEEPTTSSTLTTAPTTSAASSSGSSSSSSQSSNSGATSDSDIQQYLSAHNTIRAQHGAADLTWSDEAAAKAQQWANGCVFQHSGGSLGAFGENLAAGTGDGYGIPQAIKSWSDEASQYSSSNPQASHFTQMVWKATTQVGCAVQSCSGIFDASFGLAKFYVCEYSPQGNVIGQFAQNVQA